MPSKSNVLLIIIVLLSASNISMANESDPEEPPPLVADEAAIASELIPEKDDRSLKLLDSTIAPGTFRTLHWAPGLSMISLNTPVPVLVAHGAHPGPKMCMTAAIHGDELNGIEIVRRILHQIDPDDLNGTIIGMPIVNLDGFRRASRYMSDRRDLNRYFPGNPNGSYASRIAHSLFHSVIVHCDYLVDIHTGSFQRVNLPQLRGNLKDPKTLAFSRHFGGMSVLHNSGASGTLRRSTSNAGIPAITMETGGPHALEPEAVSNGVKGIKNMLHNLGMYKTLRLWVIPQPVFYRSTWVRANQGGILLSKVNLEDTVSIGQVLAKVIDPITNTSSDILSPINGIILGKAIDQVVGPGFATFHIGIIATEAILASPTASNATSSDDNQEGPEDAVNDEQGDASLPSIEVLDASEPPLDSDS